MTERKHEDAKQHEDPKQGRSAPPVNEIPPPPENWNPDPPVVPGRETEPVGVLSWAQDKTAKEQKK
jgi:hypothetical protein